MPVPELMARRDVRAVLTIGLAAMFLLAGYELVRSVSTSLYIEAYGARRLPYVMAAGPVVLFGVLYGYGRLISAQGARRTLALTSILAGLAILACFLGIRAGSRLAAAVLYIVREVYIVLLIEQYWSFINSVLAAPMAKRLNGPICGVASVGSIAGGLLAGQLAGSLGSQALLLFAAASVVPAAAFSLLAYRLLPEPDAVGSEPRGAGDHLGLGLFRQHRVLVGLAVLVALTQTVSAVLDLRFSGLLEAALPERDLRTAYLGNFYALLNGVSLVLQFVAAPLVLRWLSLRAVHLAIPCIHLAAAVVLLAHPVLAAGAGAYLIFKAVDYSLFRAGKEIFYIPLPFDARYRAKEVIDAFGYRAAKGGVSGALAAAALAVGAIPGAVYALIAAVASGLWLITAERMTRPQPTPNE